MASEISRRNRPMEMDLKEQGIEAKEGKVVGAAHKNAVDAAALGGGVHQSGYPSGWAQCHFQALSMIRSILGCWETHPSSRVIR